ncbi:hypothetical protein Poli38472_011371 [Pythium oligandrum]|uniref:Uncharacterized protein n=1 Tax=Pythium oligandrum TaxID=41045 RepID=A0A8K1CJ05_PYTOL|nr:hypothetical protein Poli38472_011371 [Pythium oligandrum]|eukprot:TMW64491.1 hypothetical protein Poli38472_011371 [Pythium oligandrum]
MAKMEHVYMFVGTFTAPNGTTWKFPDDLCLNQWSATEVVPRKEADRLSKHMLDSEWFPCYVEVRYDGTFVPIQQNVAGDYLCREMAAWTLHDYGRTWAEVFIPNPDNKYEVLSLVMPPDQEKIGYQRRFPLSVFRIAGGGAMINTKIFMNQKFLVFEQEAGVRCLKPEIWKDGRLLQYGLARANLSLISDGYFELTIRGMIYIYIVLMRIKCVYLPIFRYSRVHGFPVNGSFETIHAGLRYGTEVFLLAFEALVSLDETIGTFLMLHEARTASTTEYAWLCTQASKILWIPVAIVTAVSLTARALSGGRLRLRVSPDAYPMLVPYLVFYAGPKIVETTPNLFQHYHTTTAGFGHVANSAKASTGGVRTILSLMHIVAPVVWPCTWILLAASILQQLTSVYFLGSGHRGNNHNLRHITTFQPISHDLMLHEHGVAANKFTQSLGLVIYGYERALVADFDLPILVRYGRPVLLIDPAAALKSMREGKATTLFVIVADQDKMYAHPLHLQSTALQIRTILPLHWQYTSIPARDAKFESTTAVDSVMTKKPSWT